VDQNHGGGRKTKCLFNDAANVHGSLGRRPFGDIFLSQELVLSVQEDGSDYLLSFASKQGTKMVGDGLRGLECGGCQFAGAHLLAEFKGGFDLGKFCGSEARHFQQILDMGAIESAKTAKVLQKGTGEVGSILPQHAFLERTLPHTKDDGEQLRLGEIVGPLGQQPFPRPFCLRPVFYPIGFHASKMKSFS
jgi:hypothetical protein